MAFTLKDIISATPIYDGSSNYLTWQKKLKSKLDLIEHSDRAAPVIFDKILVGRAKCLWESFDDDTQKSVKSTLTEMEKNFGTAEAKQSAYEKIVNQKQGNSKAVEYASIQITNCYNCDPKMDQLSVIGHIRRGLNPEYRKLIIANPINSINGLMEVLERIDFEFFESAVASSEKLPSNTTDRSTPNEINYIQNRQGGGSWNLRDRGGRWPNRTRGGYRGARGRYNQRPAFQGVCWGCGRTGHRESECPSRNSREINVVGWDKEHRHSVILVQVYLPLARSASTKYAVLGFQVPPG